MADRLMGIRLLETFLVYEANPIWPWNTRVLDFPENELLSAKRFRPLFEIRSNRVANVRRPIGFSCFPSTVTICH